MAAGSNFSIAALVILIQLTINLNLCLAAAPIHPSGRNTRFIRTSCRSTLHPNLCLATFSRYTARIQGSPRLLASTALSVAFNTTRSTTKALISLSKRRGLKRREAAALRDCMEQLGNSVDELKDSVSSITKLRRGNEFRRRMSDMQTWVSAALTNDDTCMGGFFSRRAMKRGFRTRVRRRVVKAAHLTSIALAFVNRYAAAVH